MLAGGNYGDFSAASLNYSANVTIQSASQTNPATFNSFHLTGSQNITVTNVDVHMAPTATSVLWAAAVGIYNSTNVTFSNSTITGGTAINGVPQTATAMDATQNVIGLPTGTGFSVVGSTGVTLTNNSVSVLDKGVNLSNSTGVTISDNQFFNTRHGAVGASNVSNLAITDNSMSDSNPWAWGQSYGDHGDFIHIWTSPPAQTSASSNITITGNVISQGAGQPIMGINFEAHTAAGSTTPIGFTGVNISDNAVILGDGQGMRLENLANSTVSNNTLIEPATGGTVTPGILFALGGATNTVVSGNVAGSIASQVNSATNTFANNYLAQDANQNAANYFNPALATQAAAMSDPAAIEALIKQALPQTTTASVYQGAAANIVANLPALNVSSTISKIVITDNAPVTLTLAQWLSNGQVLGQLVNQNGSSFHIVVKDAATMVAAGLDLLNGLTNLNSIVISDNQPLWLKAAQLANDGAALAKLVNANGSTPPLNISDTAANVGAVLDALKANYARLGSISVTDKGAITLDVDQFMDQSLLAKIHGLSAYYVHDTAANIDRQLDQLSALQRATGAHFTSIMVTDGHPLQVSYAELVADANVIRMLTNPDGTQAKITVVDTGANILANLNSLNLMTNVGSIVVCDGATLTLTSALKTADALALSKMVYLDGSALHPLVGTTSLATIPLTVTAPAAPAAPTPYTATAAEISAKLDTLNGSSLPTVISDNQALKLTVSQALNDGQALSHVTNANGAAVVVNVVDTAANIAAHLDTLGAVRGLGTITASDGQMLNLSVAQLNADAAVVAHLAAGSVSVTDTAANIAAGLAVIGADAAVASVTVSNNTMVRVDASVFDADAAGLAKIVGRHIVDDINIKGQAYTSEFFSYNDAGVHTSNTFVAADGTRTIYALVGSQVFSSQPSQQIIHAVDGHNVYDFVQGFGSETIYGFTTGHDYIGIDHRIVSTAAQAIALMSDDGQGDVVMRVSASETVTIVGTDMAHLTAQKDLFHFF